MADNAKWYVVHTYSGYENTVEKSIQKAAENRHMEDLILEVKIPTETVTERTKDKEKTYERKIFPGYVLVKMIMTDETWHLVRNARGSTGFVSMDGKPVPLTEQEVLALGMERHEVVVGFDVGDTVKVTDGWLKGNLATVDKLDVDKNRAIILVTMGGRENSVEIDLDQIEAVKDE